ncbi:MAG: sulfotransferase [Pseudomonadota bacterium]
MPDNAPIFILTVSRSGSTLLRLALNAHPEIVAPPEMHLLTLGQRLLWTHRITLPPDETDVWKPAIAATRAVIGRMMEALTERSGKVIWCEKSVTSINHLDVLSGVFPEARRLCLVRHAADMVASALRAIATDPTGYDFEPYLADEPLRPQALLRYWVDKTEQIVAVEDDGGLRVRYEDFVKQPGVALDRIARAFDLDGPPDWADRIYDAPAELGPGDASAYARDRVTIDSLGRGSTLDWGGVSRNLVRRANRLLDQLGYAPLESQER